MYNKSHRRRRRNHSKRSTKNHRYKRRYYSGGTSSIIDNYNQVNNIFKTQPLNLSAQPFMQ
jgi:hypothetical protein